MKPDQINYKFRHSMIGADVDEETQVEFNFLFLIMKFLYDCSLMKDIGYLPYGMILMPFF